MNIYEQSSPAIGTAPVREFLSTHTVFPINSLLEDFSTWLHKRLLRKRLPARFEGETRTAPTVKFHHERMKEKSANFRCFHVSLLRRSRVA